MPLIVDGKEWKGPVKIGSGGKAEPILDWKQDEGFVKARKRAEVRSRQAEVESLQEAALLDFRHVPERVPTPFAVEHEGQTHGFCARSLRGADFCEIGLWMGSVGFGLVTLSDFRAQAIFNSALVLVAVTSASGERFFATLAEVESLQDEPGAAPLFQQLQTAVFAHNPALCASPESESAEARKARQVAAADPMTRRIVASFLYPPDTPSDALALIRWAAYYAGVVALRCGLLDGWQMQEPHVIRQLAQRFPIVALSIERETRLKSTSVITELITRTKGQQ